MPFCMLLCMARNSVRALVTPVGSGSNGQLGISGVYTDKTTPTAVTVPGAVTGGWTAVSAGQYHTCSIASGGALYCFGAWCRGGFATESVMPVATDMQPRR